MEWRRLRLGDVTASNFHKLLTKPPATGIYRVTGSRGEWYVEGGEIGRSGACARKADAEELKRELVAEWQETHWSDTAEQYLDDNLAELWTGQPMDEIRSAATDWGTEVEPLAVSELRDLYRGSFQSPEGELAYIHHPTEPFIGCSPDGFIDDDGVIEIKCPYNSGKWVRAYRKGLRLPSEYIPQVQGQMWITGRQWCLFVYFDPRMDSIGDPLMETRIDRDDAYIDNTLAPRVIAFRNYLRAEYDRLAKQETPF